MAAMNEVSYCYGIFEKKASKILTLMPCLTGGSSLCFGAKMSSTSLCGVTSTDYDGVDGADLLLWLAAMA